MEQIMEITNFLKKILEEDYHVIAFLYKILGSLSARLLYPSS